VSRDWLRCAAELPGQPADQWQVPVAMCEIDVMAQHLTSKSRSRNAWIDAELVMAWRSL
jgi:hypothetical protein